MARESYTFPDDVVLDANGNFGIERAATGGWVAFNDAADIGLGARRLWTSTPFATDSEAQMVRIHAQRLAKEKQEEAHLRLVSSIERKRGNRSYTAAELEGEAHAAMTGKGCPLAATRDGAGEGEKCGGPISFRTWGIRVQNGAAHVVAIARCGACHRPSSFQNAL